MCYQWYQSLDYPSHLYYTHKAYTALCALCECSLSGIKITFHALTIPETKTIGWINTNRTSRHGLTLYVSSLCQ